MNLSDRTLGGASSAGRQFTDRETFLAAFDHALDALTPDAHRVLVYYGVGGIGKSRLIRRLRERLLGTADRDPSPPRPDVVHTVVDFQESENRRAAKALERARARLHAQGVRFPTFDVAFAIYWKLANPSLPLSKSELAFLDEGEVSGDVIAALAEAPIVGWLAKIPRFAEKATRAVQNWWTERGEKELSNLRGLDEPTQVEAWLPAFFGADLRAWLDKNPDRRAALFVDTHEALWDGRGSGVSGTPPDDWLREWVSHLEGVLVVIGSRRKLRWAEANPGWATVIEPQHLVGGLAPEDADLFLRRAGMTEPDLRRAIAGEGNDLGKSQGVPQYLDLAMETYEAIQTAEGRAPRVDEFDATLPALLKRFLSYVDPTRRAALFVLSVPETFDRARFADLMATFSTGVPATGEGLRSITEFTFVDEPEPGRYAFHALVREALAARHAAQDPDERNDIHRHLLDRAEAVLAEVDPRSITDPQRQALRDATEHARALMEPEAFLDWYWTAEKSFDRGADYGFLRAQEEAALAYAEEVLGPEHPQTLTAISNLGFLMMATGDYAGAEPLYRRALDASERVLGPEHPQTLVSVNSLGYFLSSTGDYAGAEPLLRRALDGWERVLGPEHPDMLVSVNNLAGLLQATGDYAGAEPLYRRALDARERVLGPEHPDTLGSVNNLAFLLQTTGDYAGAEALYRRAIVGLEKKLGPDHPWTKGARANLEACLAARDAS